MADFSIKALDAANIYRRRMGEFLAAYENLLGIDKEYIALGVGGAIPLDAFADITNVEFTDGVGTTETMLTYIDGIKTNLYKLSDGSQR